MANMYEIIEQKGDITFYEDSKGNQYQQIGNGEIFKVKDGSIAYKHMKTVNGYEIKYNTNGVYGFSIFRGKDCLEDGFWVLDDAIYTTEKM